LPLVVSFSPLLDESARFADLVLPDATFLERWDVVAPGRGTRALSLRQPVVPPVRDTRPTGEVILRLAAALGGAVASAFPWHSYREAVAAGLLRLPGGARDAMSVLESEGAWLAPNDEEVRRADGAGGFVVLADVNRTIPDPGLPTEGEPASFPFVLVPFRGPGYAEGGTRHLPWLCELPLTELLPRQLGIEISPSDASALGIANGDRVDVESPYGRLTTHARVAEDIRTGTLGLPLGGGAWPVAGAADNPLRLLADHADPRTGQWLACGTRARVRRSG